MLERDLILLIWEQVTFCFFLDKLGCVFKIIFKALDSKLLKLASFWQAPPYALGLNCIHFNIEIIVSSAHSVIHHISPPCMHSPFCGHRAGFYGIPQVAKSLGLGHLQMQRVRTYQPFLF